MKKNTVLLFIAIVTFLSLITFATYAYFQVGTLTVTNVANANTVTERNNMTFITIGGGMNLNISLANMTNTSAGTLAASNSTTLKVEFTANTSYNIVCTYDIVYEWTSNTSNRYTAHTANVVDNEFTIQATLASNSHVNEGINHIKNEVDLSGAVGNNTSAVVVSRAQIDSTGTTKNTATWTIYGKFYNVNADQSAHAGKTYAGKFKVDNVSCVAGTLNSANTLAKYLVNTATKSGTSPVGSSPWQLSLDNPGEWRYAGKNPNNYITFSGDYWRIVGVVSNVTYCTGTYTDSTCSEEKTGTLVKITRNSAENTVAWDTAGKNNWYNATIKPTLQERTYASDTHVAVANWSLYGSPSGYTTPAAGSVHVFYNKERNIGDAGGVYSSNPSFWYGKVGMLYPSDYGFSTGGGTTYKRTGCLDSPIYSWNSGTYLSDCANNAWVRYLGITTSAPSSGYNIWLMTPGSERADYVFYIQSAGRINRTTASTATNNIRPVVYLTPETLVSGTHAGTYADPYVIS